MAEPKYGFVRGVIIGQYALAVVLTLVGAGGAVLLVEVGRAAAWYSSLTDEEVAEILATGASAGVPLGRGSYTWAGPGVGELAVALVWLIVWLFGASMAAARGQALEMQRRQSINSDRQLKVLKDIRRMQPPTH